jgi:hypothetical protein
MFGWLGNDFVGIRKVEVGEELFAEGFVFYFNLAMLQGIFQEAPFRCSVVSF